MLNKQNGSALVVVLLILVLLAGMGAAFLTQPEKSNAQNPEYTQREADLLCQNTLEDACSALWFYKTETPASWNKILSSLESDSIDPTIHRREYIDKVDHLIDQSNDLLSTVEKSTATLKKGDQKEAKRLLDQVTRAIRALATVRAIAGEVAPRWTEEVDHAFNLSRTLRGYLSDEPAMNRRDFVLDKIARRGTNRQPLPIRPTSYFGNLLPAGGCAVKIVVRDNDDGDENTNQDQDNRVFVYVTALLPEGTIAQTETLVEYDPHAVNHSVKALQSRKLQ